MNDNQSKEIIDIVRAIYVEIIQLKKLIEFGNIQKDITNTTLRQIRGNTNK